jgi:predicted Zn-dependent peptidase
MQSPFTITSHVFGNGLSCVVATIPKSAGFEISAHFNTGSRDENVTNNGISHFLEHMMFRGSKTYPNSILLAQSLEKMGGETNAMTSQDTTTYWLKGALSKWNEALEVFTDFLLYPNFADLELERTVVLNELANDYNENNDIIDIETLSHQNLFVDHGLGLPIIGTRNSIENFTLEDLISKKNQYYIPSRCVIGVICSSPADQILRDVERFLGQSWEQSLPPAPHRSYLSYHQLEKQIKPRVTSFVNNADNQYTLKLLWPAFGGYANEVVTQTFIQRLLDDGMYTRLPSTIREKLGLVYEINADSNSYTDIGTFGIDAVTSPIHFTKLVETLGTELCRFVQDGPTAQEMEHIRFRYLHDLDLIDESASHTVSRKLNQYFAGQELSLEQERDIVRNLTKREVQNLAKTLLANPIKNISLIGPKAKKSREQLEKLGSRLKNLGA